MPTKLMAQLKKDNSENRCNGCIYPLVVRHLEYPNNMSMTSEEIIQEITSRDIHRV